MTAWQIVPTVFGGVLALISVLGILWSLSRVKGVEQTVGLMSISNSELREEVEYSRRALADERVECAAKIAMVEGQLRSLTDGLAERIVAATVKAISASDRQVVNQSKTRSTDSLIDP